MRPPRSLTLLLPLVLTAALVGCDAADGPVITGDDDLLVADEQVDYSLIPDADMAALTQAATLDADLVSRLGYDAEGAVFTMSDAASGNAVLAFARDINGRLTPAGQTPTGGLGSGDGLNGTSNPMALAHDNRFLYAVNGRSNSVSAFRVRRDTDLRRIGSYPTNGTRPISVTVRGNLVYVLNAGTAAEAGSIVGFHILRNGSLREIAGSTRPIAPGSGSPSQIDFTPDGRFLVVTDKPTNTITTYLVDGLGVAGPPEVQAANGQTTFGFDFDRRGRLIVSEAFGGAAGASAVSSYAVSGDGLVSTITESAPTNQTAACWVETFGPFAFATNTGSSSVSGFFVRPEGALVRLHDDGVTVSTGAGSQPLDMDVALRYLYVQSQGTDRLSVYQIAYDGSLTSVSNGAAGGLPPTAVGVAAF
jgi:6-phosphogluconolactonase (cycloisomerase 2 family)